MCLPFGRRLRAVEMQAHYAVTFERDMGGFTVETFQGYLPGAFAPAPLTWGTLDGTSGQASVALASGQAHVTWHALPPRTIALMKMHRVHVGFDFTGVQEDERQRVMKRFDLVMLRGGG
jgi:hypothetical protein